VEADQPCNRDARFDRIADQSIAKRQGVPIDTENGGGASRLRCALAAFTVTRWFTVAQVDEEHGSSFGDELRRYSTHDRFEIVGVGTNASTSYGPDIDATLHQRDADRRCQVTDAEGSRYRCLP
jgi:hypothetical protein